MNNLVVLINPAHDDEVSEKIAVSYGAKTRKVRREDPPISIINMGGFIRDHGYDVVILDTHIDPEYKTTLKRFVDEKPLAIGFSVILGKNTRNAITLSNFVKDINPEIPIVWGGKLTSLAGSLIFDQKVVDYTITGDGEFPFLALLGCLKNGSDYHDIPGLGYKEDDVITINENTTYVENLDEIYTSKDFGWELIKDYINYRQVPYFINLYTSRGCRFDCAFCYLKDIKQLDTKMRYRRRSADNIIKEIEYLKKTYGINVVTFGDDDFLANTKELLPVFDYLRSRNIYIEHIWTNIYHLNPETIQLLSGICQTVCYSIETVTPRLQKILNKRIPVERIKETNVQLRKYGINTVHNILFGIPTETDEDTKANIDLLRELKQINPHVRANTYILSPIPDTPIFEYAKEISGKDIEWNMDDLADFHFRYMNQSSEKFRPYHTPEDNTFFEDVSELTNELFTELNTDPTSEQINRIQNNKRMSYIFGDIGNILKPEDGKRKYILDRVLDAMDRGDPIPLIEPF